MKYEWLLDKLLSYSSLSVLIFNVNISTLHQQQVFSSPLYLPLIDYVPNTPFEDQQPYPQMQTGKMKWKKNEKKKRVKIA